MTMIQLFRGSSELARSLCATTFRICGDDSLELLSTPGFKPMQAMEYPCLGHGAVCSLGSAEVPDQVAAQNPRRRGLFLFSAIRDSGVGRDAGRSGRDAGCLPKLPRNIYLNLSWQQVSKLGAVLNRCISIIDYMERPICKTTMP
jgi:hypothetical protein